MTDTDLWWQNTIVTNPFLWDETVMGIDWGESTNAWAIVGYKGRVLAHGVVTESPEGLETLLAALHNYAHPTTGLLAPVGIETPRRLLVSALADAGVAVIPLNPKSVKTARGVKNPRNAAKTDPKDAVLIANILRNNPNDYHPLHASTNHARAITLLHRAREEAVRGAVRQAGRVRSILAEYHPNAQAAFTVEQMATNLAPYWVLRDALTPAAGARLRAEGIATRMMKPGGRGSAKGLDNAAARVHAALNAPSLAYPTEYEAAFAETLRTDLEVLRTVVEHRVMVDKRLREAVQSHPLWDLLSPATGAGGAVVGGLIAELGDDPRRFKTADGLMAFAGSAPAHRPVRWACFRPTPGRQRQPTQPSHVVLVHLRCAPRPRGQALLLDRAKQGLSPPSRTAEGREQTAARGPRLHQERRGLGRRPHLGHEHYQGPGRRIRPRGARRARCQAEGAEQGGRSGCLTGQRPRRQNRTHRRSQRTSDR